MTERLAEIRKELKKKLKKERFEHTVGVMYTVRDCGTSVSSVGGAVSAGWVASGCWTGCSGSASGCWAGCSDSGSCWSGVEV